MVVDFPYLGRGTDIQVHKAQRKSIRFNPEMSLPKHIIIKVSKTKHKERIFKTARGNRLVTYKGNFINISANFSAETLRARREWDDTFNVLIFF